MDFYVDLRLCMLRIVWLKVRVLLVLTLLPAMNPMKLFVILDGPLLVVCSFGWVLTSLFVGLRCISRVRGNCRRTSGYTREGW